MQCYNVIIFSMTVDFLETFFVYMHSSLQKFWPPLEALVLFRDETVVPLVLLR